MSRLALVLLVLLQVFALCVLAASAARPTSDDPKGLVTVAFGIMVYQRQGVSAESALMQFQRLLRTLYDPVNTYAIHVDSKSDPTLIAGINRILQRLPNAVMLESTSVAWGGISVVERTLALAQAALELDQRWSYFVNIGHEDYPNASPREIRKALTAMPAGRNYMKCWHLAEHDFFGQIERHGPKARKVVVDDFAGMVHPTGFSKPADSMRALGFQFYKSLQQMVISRDFCRHAVYSADARRLLLVTASLLAPDEVFFPTLLQQSDSYRSTATCDSTLHYSHWIRPGHSWHPEYLDLTHLELLLGGRPWVGRGDVLFFRKVDFGSKSAALLSVIDALNGGKSLESCLPVMLNWLRAQGSSLSDTSALSEVLSELTRRRVAHDQAVRSAFLSARNGPPPPLLPPERFHRHSSGSDGADWSVFDGRRMRTGRGRASRDALAQ
ncbi:core-2/I-branching enzyme-domain-containing protein [Tribonema minus]|uniref:protein xylosyltransferase n=1 Tax=Tribonema minus TaxID=303371 RepID=A0A835YXC2_9STRA|nr:core-2/I-branching enzyme-domain-containing protein [Tribonema minus]